MRILSWWEPLLLPREWLEGGDGGVGEEVSQKAAIYGRRWLKLCINRVIANIDIVEVNSSNMIRKVFISL